MTEEWRPCYGGFYAVSNMGRVRRAVGGMSTFAGRVLSPRVLRCGYLQVNLSRHGTVRKQECVHVLVAEAFLGPRPAGMQVNHKNGIKTDARLENLEYVTRSENMKHALSMGLIAPRKGERQAMAKLTEDKVREIRVLRATTRMSQRAIGDRFGVCGTVVCRILSGALWGHVA